VGGRARDFVLRASPKIVTVTTTGGSLDSLLCALSIQGRIARYNRVTKSPLGQNATAAANESDDQGYGIRPTVTSRAVVPLAEKCSSLPATFPFPSTLVLPVDPVETQVSGSRVRKKE
jgi:hypothetical protein